MGHLRSIRVFRPVIEDSSDTVLSSNAIVSTWLVIELNMDVWGRAKSAETAADEGDDESDSTDVEIGKLDKWVLCEGTLCRLADAEASGKEYMNLNKPDLLLMDI